MTNAKTATSLRQYSTWLKHRLRVHAMLVWKQREFEQALQPLPRITGPALVVGSAPHPEKPIGVSADWFRISINASQLVLDHFGLPPPNLTIMQPKIKVEDEGRTAYWQVLRGHRTDHVLFIVNNKNDGSIASFLAENGYHTDKITFVSHLVRKAVVTQISKRYLGLPHENERSVSNGIFAVMLALKLGASQVVMSGFSLHDGWFHAPDLQAPRKHQRLDRLACQIMVKRRLPVFTSDPAFASQTGLPLWRGQA